MEGIHEASDDASDVTGEHHDWLERELASLLELSGVPPQDLSEVKQDLLAEVGDVYSDGDEDLDTAEEVADAETVQTPLANALNLSPEERLIGLCWARGDMLAAKSI